MKVIFTLVLCISAGIALSGRMAPSNRQKPPVATTTTKPATTTTKPTTTTTKPTTTTVKPYPVPSSKCKCGVSTTGRIVNGTDVRPGELPWQGGVQYNSPCGWDTFAGAVLISDVFFVTAAQSLVGFNISTIRMIVGVTNLTTNYTVHQIEKITLHPEYNSTTLKNDIALIKIKTPVVFTTLVFPICLPSVTVTELFVGKNVVLSGYGYQSENASSGSLILKKTTVAGIANSECQSRYPPGYVFPSSLCTYAPYKDACTHDAGGPVNYKDTNGIYFLAGIISWGEGCARKNFPAVNTRMTSYTAWIHNNTGRSICTRSMTGQNE